LINIDRWIPAPGTLHRGYIPAPSLRASEKHVKTCYIPPSIYAKFTPMATYQKRGEKTRAQICVRGVRRSKTLESKAAARAWAAQTESEILGGQRGEIPDKTFSDLLDRYVKDVSKGKKGERWESIRIEALKRLRIASVRLKDMNPTHASEWRDERLESVSGSSVIREKNLLSHACQIAVDEWRWLRENPFSRLRMPKPNRARDRIMSESERVKLGESADTPMLIKVLAAADFSVETGMRAGEICNVKVSGKVGYLSDTKNGESREVPLSEKALEIWESGHLTGLTPRQIDANWRKLTKKSKIEDLHFHDMRHTAITKLSKKLNVMELARMVGHKNINQLLIYYNESAEDIAKKL